MGGELCLRKSSPNCRSVNGTQNVSTPIRLLGCFFVRFCAVWRILNLNCSLSEGRKPWVIFLRLSPPPSFWTPKSKVGFNMDPLGNQLTTPGLNSRTASIRPRNRFVFVFICCLAFWQHSEVHCQISIEATVNIVNGILYNYMTTWPNRYHPVAVRSVHMCVSDAF